MPLNVTPRTLISWRNMLPTTKRQRRKQNSVELTPPSKVAFHLTTYTCPLTCRITSMSHLVLDMGTDIPGRYVGTGTDRLFHTQCRTHTHIRQTRSRDGGFIFRKWLIKSCEHHLTSTSRQQPLPPSQRQRPPAPAPTSPRHHHHHPQQLRWQPNSYQQRPPTPHHWHRARDAFASQALGMFFYFLFLFVLLTHLD